MSYRFFSDLFFDAWVDSPTYPNNFRITRDKLYDDFCAFLQYDGIT